MRIKIIGPGYEVREEIEEDGEPGWGLYFFDGWIGLGDRDACAAFGLKGKRSWRDTKPVPLHRLIERRR